MCGFKAVEIQLRREMEMGKSESRRECVMKKSSEKATWSKICLSVRLHNFPIFKCYCYVLDYYVPWRDSVCIHDFTFSLPKSLKYVIIISFVTCTHIQKTRAGGNARNIHSAIHRKIAIFFVS